MDETEVQWIHVALAAVVVVMVLVAQSGTPWVSLAAWAGAAGVGAWWLLLLGRVRAREPRGRRPVGD